MSDTSQGPGWWQASDHKWYPPESHPANVAATSSASAPVSAGPTAPTGAPKAPQPAVTSRKTGASAGTVRNYNKMLETFPPGDPAPTAPANWVQQPDGNWWSWDGSAWQLQPEGPGAPATTTSRRFTTEGALNKAGLLGLVALLVGTVAYIGNLSIGVAFVAMIVGLGVGLWCSFSPRRAPVLAPLYAVAEGLVLGVISRFYADNGTHVVPLAIVGTVAVVAGVWTIHRTGLVRVTNRFVQVTSVMMLVALAIMVVMILTGWGIAGVGGLLVFGVLYLVLAVMSLFIDFSFVDRAAQAGIDADAEWFSAYTILVASVMVYLALLRIFGRGR